MVNHKVDLLKCKGCGQCIESCGLELWELFDIGDGKKRARVVPEAGEVCHTCRSCEDRCPEGAITIIDE